MGNKNNIGGAKAAARVPPPPSTTKKPRLPPPPPVTKCTSAFCPVKYTHPAKKYLPGDSDRPEILKHKERRLAVAIISTQDVNQPSLKTFIDTFYSVHGLHDGHVTPQPATPPRKVKCVHPHCPVKAWHEAKVFHEHAEDLPTIVKQLTGKVYAALAKKIDTSHTDDHKFLDRFFWVHYTYGEDAGGDVEAGEASSAGNTAKEAVSN